MADTGQKRAARLNRRSVEKAVRFGHGILYPLQAVLASQADADAYKWSINAKRRRIARVDAYIHRVEEKVRAIACTDFDVFDAEGYADHAAHVWHRNGAVRVVASWTLIDQLRVLIFTLGKIMSGLLMLRMCSLPAEQHSGIGAPIECDSPLLRIAHKRRRAVPRKRRAYSVEASRSVAGEVIGMKVWFRYPQRKCGDRQIF